MKQAVEVVAKYAIVIQNKIAKTIEKYEKIKTEVQNMNKKIRLTISQKFDSTLLFYEFQKTYFIFYLLNL